MNGNAKSKDQGLISIVCVTALEKKILEELIMDWLFWSVIWVYQQTSASVREAKLWGEGAVPFMKERDLDAEWLCYLTLSHVGSLDNTHMGRAYSVRPPPPPVTQPF